MRDLRTGTAGPAGHASMRESNRSFVLSLLRENAQLSRADIAKATSLAKPTVSTIVEGLLASGLVREVGVGTTTRSGGRPPILLEFNERSEFLAGVHVGVSRTTVVVADALGTEVARDVVTTPHGRPGPALRRIADKVRSTAAAAGAVNGLLTTVGVVVPGLVDHHRGLCLLAPNLGWKEVAVADMLHASLGRPVFVHNTAQAVAVSEQLDGAAQGAADVAVLYAGSGVGAGLLTRGRGIGGIAGEIGHCYLPGAKHRCTCGKTGCLETVASGWALVRDVEAAVAAGRRTTATAYAGNAALAGRHVAEAAASGDALATRLVARAGEALGIAASWLVNMFSPQVLVLAGGLLEAGEPLLAPLRSTAQRLSLPQAWEKVVVRQAELAQDAEVRGAVLLALQQAHSSRLPQFQG